MEENLKQLLLQDLCARLPYGVKVKDRNGVYELTAGNTEFTDLLYNGKCNIKPYLFPLSSMTEEQKKEYRDTIRPAVIASIEENDEDENNFPSLITIAPDVVSIGWCNKNHLDIRGLIPKGLAIDCTNLNIY